MSVTLSEMFGEVRSDLGEPTEGFFTNTEITRWLNEGIKRFCLKTKILRSYTDYTWAISTDSVPLTTIIATSGHNNPVIESAHWYSSSLGSIPLIISVLEEINHEPDRPVSSVKGTPTTLWIDPWVADVGMHPTPDAAGTLRVRYYYRPASLAASADTIATALEEYWEGICAYAVYRGKSKDIDHFTETQAQESLARFQATITDVKMDNAQKYFANQTIGFIKDYSEPS